MSGMGGRRLFEMLPQYMPANLKHDVVESLWRQYAPESKTRVIVGWGVSEADFWPVFRTHLGTLMATHFIPAMLARQFSWLDGGDVQVTQQFLNALRTNEAGLALEAAKNVTELLFEQVNRQDRIERHFEHSFVTRKHHFSIAFDPKQRGVVINRAERYRPPTPPNPFVQWLDDFARSAGREGVDESVQAY